MGGNGSGKADDIFKQYKVEAFPTNYLLDSAGKVVYRATGYDETGLRSALEKLDIKRR